MVDALAEKKYITYMMNKLPEEKADTKTYTLNRGESLWDLAKKSVNNNGKKASNAEISEYMLRIAKLNGLDSYEKMNNIKANTKLYVPENTKNIEPTKTNKSNTSQPIPHKRTSAEESALNVISKLFNDKTISVQRPKLGFKSKMYHVYSSAEDKQRKTLIMSFEMPDNGKLERASFEDSNNNLNSTGYDYNLDERGRIFTNKYNLNIQKKGQLSQEEMEKFQAKLNELKNIAKPTM